MTTQVSQALPETNRRVRTSAAMIGLAVSMGAYGVPIPHQGDRALAADTPTGEPLSSDVSASFETAKAFSNPGAKLSPTATESQPSQIRHTVQEGQTLWDVARFYNIDSSAIAAANGLTLDTVLTVGQVLIVPTDVRIAQAPGAISGSASMPTYYGPVAGRSTTPQTVAALPEASVNAALKSKQDNAVEALKAKRESLRSSLTALQNKAQVASVPVTTIPDQQPTQAAGIGGTPVTQPAARVPSVLPSADKVQSSKLANALPETNAAESTAADSEPNIALRSLPSTSTEVPTSSFDGTSKVQHRVGPGDTLAGIARSHGVSLSQLIAANQISNPNYIFVNQVLVIPQSQKDSASSQSFTGAIASIPTPAPVDVSRAATTPKQSVAAASPAVVEGTRVAANAPFGGSSQQLPAIDSSPNLLRYNQIETLKLEIDQLRARYHSDGTPAKSVVLSTAEAAANKSSRDVEVAIEPVNPEFNPTKYSRLSGIRQRLKTTSTDNSSSSTTVPSATRSEPQVVAVAPLGSQNYDPIQAKLGQTVSPDMPPLGSGSEYLPGAPSRFEGYIWPTKGVLTSPYGWRWGRMHKGIDIAGPVGTPIVAAADGRVTYAGWNSGGYGYLVEIEHPDGSLTLYAHNSRILVQVGQDVAQGQQISEMGSTGYSTGPHLHFEVHPSGKGAVNPMAFLPKR